MQLIKFLSNCDKNGICLKEAKVRESMEERRKKAICTFGLICTLPIVFAVPGISAYPLTLAGAILGAVAFVNVPGDEKKNIENEVEHDHESTRDRARPAIC